MASKQFYLPLDDMLEDRQGLRIICSWHGISETDERVILVEKLKKHYPNGIPMEVDLANGNHRILRLGFAPSGKKRKAVDSDAAENNRVPGPARRTKKRFSVPTAQTDRQKARNNLTSSRVISTSQSTQLQPLASEAKLNAHEPQVGPPANVRKPIPEANRLRRLPRPIPFRETEITMTQLDKAHSHINEVLALISKCVEVEEVDICIVAKEVEEILDGLEADLQEISEIRWRMETRLRNWKDGMVHESREARTVKVKGIEDYGEIRKTMKL